MEASMSRDRMRLGKDNLSEENENRQNAERSENLVVFCDGSPESHFLGNEV